MDGRRVKNGQRWQCQRPPGKPCKDIIAFTQVFLPTARAAATQNNTLPAQPAQRGNRMPNQASNELQTIQRPIESLLHKSEKARAKLAAGAWQHTMLGANINALRTSLALLAGSAHNHPSQADLTQAMAALVDMLRRTEATRNQFAVGTAQHTLIRNRIHALQTAKALVAQAMAASGAAEG